MYRDAVAADLQRAACITPRMVILVAARSLAIPTRGDWLVPLAESIPPAFVVALMRRVTVLGDVEDPGVGVGVVGLDPGGCLCGEIGNGSYCTLPGLVDLGPTD